MRMPLRAFLVFISGDTAQVSADRILLRASDIFSSCDGLETARSAIADE